MKTLVAFSKAELDETLQEYSALAAKLKAHPAHAGNVRDAMRVLLYALTLMESLEDQVAAENVDRYHRAVYVLSNYFRQRADEISEKIGQSLISVEANLKKFAAMIGEGTSSTTGRFLIKATDSGLRAYIPLVQDVLEELVPKMESAGVGDIYRGKVLLVDAAHLRRPGHGSEYVGAAYFQSKDAVWVDPHALDVDFGPRRENLLRRIAHEYGHRWWFKKLDADEPYDYKRLWLHATDFVTPYAETNEREDFAESFAHLVMQGKAPERLKLALEHRLPSE